MIFFQAIMSENIMELQHQIRHNSDELQDFLRDLGNWTKEMEAKDEQIKKKKAESKANKPGPEPTRSVDELKRKSDPSNSTENKTIDPNKKTKVNVQPKKSEKKTRISSHDFDAWEKYNAEEELEKIKAIPNTLKETELRDMAPDKRLQRAIAEKDRGNERFKNGKYSEAIQCYTRGMQCDPKNAILPANRAMAYLKLEEWKLAEYDCSLALSIDDKYVKAYQRRGTARKYLKFFQKAVEDFEHVLLLESNNSQAKKDLEELKAKIKEAKEIKATKKEDTQKENLPLKSSNIKGMFESKLNIVEKGTLPGQIFPVEKPPHLRSSVPLKRLQIVEVASEEEEKPKITMNISESTPRPQIEVIEEKNAPEPSSKNTEVKPRKPLLVNSIQKEINAKSEISEVKSSNKKQKKPSTSVQFMSVWSKLSSEEDRRNFLKLLEPSDFPKVFKHSMEPSVFSGILQTLKNASPVSAHALGLSRVPRISAMIMFLSQGETAIVRDLMGKVQQEGTLSPKELKEVKSCFA